MIPDEFIQDKIWEVETLDYSYNPPEESRYLFNSEESMLKFINGKPTIDAFGFSVYKTYDMIPHNVSCNITYNTEKLYSLTLQNPITPTL